MAQIKVLKTTLESRFPEIDITNEVLTGREFEIQVRATVASTGANITFDIIDINRLENQEEED